MNTAALGNLTPDAHAALAYDALRFLAEAIQSGTTEEPQLRDAWPQLRTLPESPNNQHGSDRNAVNQQSFEASGRTIHLPETIQPEAEPNQARLLHRH